MYLLWATYTQDGTGNGGASTTYQEHDKDGQQQLNFFVPGAATTSADSSSEGATNSYSSGPFSMTWQIVNDEISITMTSQTTGWLSVGLGQSSSMSPSGKSQKKRVFSSSRMYLLF